MRSKLIACALVFFWLQLQPVRAQFKSALPGYRYEFPRDHFNHPDFKTEWWYYTGNVAASDGRHFGFELTFFRLGTSRDPGKNSTWDVQDLYLAHLALSDLDGGEFFHSERANRAGPGIAGAQESEQRVWNGNWEAQWSGEDQELLAVVDRFSVSLHLHPEKPLVIHGENGVSQKAEGLGKASHYISFTRLKTSGVIQLKGKTYQVSGLSWMDHEFFTHQLEPDQAGWDWLSLQLNDNSELMLFRIRHKDGSIEPYSAGTYVDPNGKSFFLRGADFSIAPTGDSWKSPVTQAIYPVRWKILVPKLGISLEATTSLKSQELYGQTRLAPTYWEGSIAVAGYKRANELSGVGYLEMTGYDRPVDLGR
jgi:predicted secreted hydrolase